MEISMNKLNKMLSIIIVNILCYSKISTCFFFYSEIRPFISGCRGNANNFRTKEECEKKCSVENPPNRLKENPPTRLIENSPTRLLDNSPTRPVEKTEINIENSKIVQNFFLY